MTTAGWILMIVSWTVISLLMLVTLWKTLTARPSSLSSTLELELDDEGPGAGESDPR